MSGSAAQAAGAVMADERSGAFLRSFEREADLVYADLMRAVETAGGDTDAWLEPLRWTRARFMRTWWGAWWGWVGNRL